MTTPPYPEGYQPYTGAPGPTGPQPNPQPTPPNYQPPYSGQYPQYGSAPNQPPYGAPAYPQPPYVPPGYQPMYAPPPPPARRSNRGWIIAVSVIVGVLLICGGCGAIAYFSLARGFQAISTSVGVISTYSGFCVDESSQDYQSAYSYFSSNLSQQVSSTAFAQRAAQLDTRDGPVSSCLSQGVAPQISGSKATVELTVIRTPNVTATPAASGTATATAPPTSSATPTVGAAPTPATGATFSGALHLVLEGSAWKIDSIDSSLDLT